MVLMIVEGQGWSEGEEEEEEERGGRQLVTKCRVVARKVFVGILAAWMG